MKLLLLPLLFLALHIAPTATPSPSASPTPSATPTVPTKPNPEYPKAPMPKTKEEIAKQDKFNAEHCHLPYAESKAMLGMFYKLGKGNPKNLIFKLIASRPMGDGMGWLDTWWTSDPTLPGTDTDVVLAVHVNLHDQQPKEAPKIFILPVPPAEQRQEPAPDTEDTPKKIPIRF